jgi:hypothetical protein
VAEEVSIRDLSNFDPSSHPAEERSDRKRTHFLQRQHIAEQSFSEVSSIDRALGQAPSEWKLVLLSQEPAWLDYVKPLVRQSLPTNLKIVEKWRKLGPDSLFPKFVFFALPWPNFASSRILCLQHSVSTAYQYHDPVRKLNRQ